MERPASGGTAVECVCCGAAADEPPLTWSRQAGRNGVEFLCESCTRDNLREIEGKLDHLWW